MCRRLAVTTRGASGEIGRRPPSLPRARVAAKPAWVRSWIRRRYKLRQAREDVEHQLARSRSGVDRAVLEGPEADTLAEQFLNQRHQVGRRAP